jgi:phenylalanyl-tRNA synthetase alpha chain
MEDILQEIEAFGVEARDALDHVSSLEDVRRLKSLFVGRNGKISNLLSRMRDLDPALRPKVGKMLNELKCLIEERCRELEERFESGAKGKGGIPIDITLPPRRFVSGTPHPVAIVMGEIVDVFVKMGFSVFEGPEIETEFYNFEALNTPKDHPARDMQATFYLSDKFLLRTHTSPVQIRVMKMMHPPIAMISPGRVYRRDTPDLTHSPQFHQVEGLLVDTNITFGDLKGVMGDFVRRTFGDSVRTRFRPSFFPFTEPSAELEISCVACGGSGCSVCKGSGWIEILGCGMVDPNVFEAVGYGIDTYTGFAFGMGVERIAMLKYGVNDIRLFYENDIRFLNQF